MARQLVKFALKMKQCLIIFTLLFVTCYLNGQSTESSIPDSVAKVSYLLKTATYDGQTYPSVELKEIIVYGRLPKGVRFNYRRHARLVYNVKKVYPYSIIVREELGRVNRLLETMPNEKDRRNFLQQYEKDILNEYEDDIKHMTITQGKILIKLIDRETANTSYDLISEYRNKFTASFWQTIARIFGTSLKSTYDPAGDDYLVEQVIREIEAGRL